MIYHGCHLKQSDQRNARDFVCGFFLFESKTKFYFRYFNFGLKKELKRSIRKTTSHTSKLREHSCMYNEHDLKRRNVLNETNKYN